MLLFTGGSLGYLIHISSDYCVSLRDWFGVMVLELKSFFLKEKKYPGSEERFLY
jgi:hypothetical protein